MLPLREDGAQADATVYEQPIVVPVLGNQGKQVRMIFTVAAGSDSLVTQDNINFALRTFRFPSPNHN
jgi:hypothetical protein